MNPDLFGVNLKRLREGKGLTQLKLALAAGLTPYGIAQFEQGRRNPTWRSVCALCAALECAPEEFAREPAADAQEQKKKSTRARNKPQK